MNNDSITYLTRLSFSVYPVLLTTEANRWNIYDSKLIIGIFLYCTDIVRHLNFFNFIRYLSASISVLVYFYRNNPSSNVILLVKKLLKTLVGLIYFYFSNKCAVRCISYINCNFRTNRSNPLLNNL